MKITKTDPNDLCLGNVSRPFESASSIKQTNDYLTCTKKLKIPASSKLHRLIEIVSVGFNARFHRLHVRRELLGFT
ncbi:hypothetical protein NQ317_005306 [Molorchus minor]|uniref:Uncharacterized protein n=1 Tax=Molorchus minor TaxID=1323400 RepID=A0ABQ9IYE5_9CUCU|nr:hypothetical protein NQ317_005306 [Molorchus minor]